MGLQSLPVAFGVDTAKWITVATIDVTQIAVALYLAFGRHTEVYAAVLGALIIPQVCCNVHRCSTVCGHTCMLRTLLGLVSTLAIVL